VRPAVRSDADWMRSAIALAARGRALSSPNPSVGCVIVRDGRVIGRGWTATGGRPHGEAMALAQAGEAARGATAYVTLEPCAHESTRGPACADLLIAAGLARVVIGCQDPDPRTNGAGIERLRAAGIAVDAVSEPEARASLAGFLTRQTLGRPFVTLKLATSLDGQIALADGSSRWITGDAARAHAHVERAQHDAILVGGGTLRADSPKLDVRLPGLEQRSPRRVLLSRMGDAPPGWTGIAAPEDIAVLDGTDWLMVEGGAEVAAAFLERDMVDRLLLYRAPVLIGRGRGALGDIGLADLAHAHGRWRLDDTRLLGKDRMESYQRIR
jgi:diaminohydroxyphosphoribosylaminopyrimidine deaminase/5-amino-6-(5-phosphoribosylamino)uracil reductase